MRERESATRRLMRIERAVGIERKELKLHLKRLVESGHVHANVIEERGRGGHPVVSYDVTENGRALRSDVARWIDWGVRLGYYPESFFYLPSDN